MKRKRTLRLLAFILASLLLLAGCQPTPEQEIVHQLTEEQYSKTASPGANLEVLRQAGEKWEESFTAYNGKLKVRISADIQTPNHDEWPVYRIKLVDYTQDIIDPIVNIIFGDAVNSLERLGKAWTKDDIMDMIIDKKAEIEMKKKDERYTDTSLEELEEGLEELEQLMERAPETSDYEKTTAQLEKDSGGIVGIQACAETGRGAKASLWVENDMGRGYGSFLRYWNTGISMQDQNACDQYTNIFPTDTYTVDIQKTREEALQEAEDFLKSIQVTDYKFEGSEKAYGVYKVQTQSSEQFSQVAYGFVFTRPYNGLPRSVLSVWDDYITGGTGNMSDGSSYRLALENDSITVIVDDEGIAGLQWYSPTEISGTDTENVPLMPFDEAKNAIRNGLKTKYTYLEENPDSDAQEIEITQIRLGYVVTNIKDNYSEYRTVPAWICYNGDTPVVGINATDGSVL